MRALVVPLASACVIAAGALLIALARPATSLPPVADAPTSYSSPAPTTGPSVRVGVIGGMVETGFWDALATRYRDETGVTIELVVAGPKDHLERAMTKPDAPGIDLLTMHASDTIVNLVADGYALDPQPWLRNDMVIVGPPDDPAGVRGMRDAVAAMRKIGDARSPVVVGASVGAQEVLRGILGAGSITLDPATVTMLFADDSREVLKIAGERRAYAIVGRIPFRTGKIPANGCEQMVAGDARLCRPYLVVVADPARVSGARVDAARRLAAWMRGAPTQAWIATFGVGRFDDRPIFFPVIGP